MKFISLIVFSILSLALTDMGYAETTNSPPLTNLCCQTDEELYPAWFTCEKSEDCVLSRDLYCRHNHALNKNHLEEWKKRDGAKNTYLLSHGISDYCGKQSQPSVEHMSGQAICKNKICLYEQRK